MEPRTAPRRNDRTRALSDEVGKQPIRYIRKEAETKRILEGHTQVDAKIEADNLLILIEVNSPRAFRPTQSLV